MRQRGLEKSAARREHIVKVDALRHFSQPHACMQPARPNAPHPGHPSCTPTAGTSQNGRRRPLCCSCCAVGTAAAHTNPLRHVHLEQFHFCPSPILRVHRNHSTRCFGFFSSAEALCYCTDLAHATVRVLTRVNAQQYSCRTTESGNCSGTEDAKPHASEKSRESSSISSQPFAGDFYFETPAQLVPRSFGGGLQYSLFALHSTYSTVLESRSSFAVHPLHIMILMSISSFNARSYKYARLKRARADCTCCTRVMVCAVHDSIAPARAASRSREKA